MTIGNLQSGNRDSFRDIEIYARLKMDELDLPDWKFGWDRARRRLGVCRLLEKSISLSVHFVRANLEAPHEIRDTILHEIAHFVSPRHAEIFLLNLDRHMPGWRQIRSDLNALPLSE